MPEVEAIAAAIEPVLSALGLELFDVELAGSGPAPTLRVIVDRDGGVDLDAITLATERISPVLDIELDRHGRLRGPFALEVSSPGLERPLRRPEHFRRAIGESVSVKARTADDDLRRLRGTLASAGEAGILVRAGDAEHHFTYDQIVQARTVFDWSPAPEPGKGSSKRGGAGGRRRKEKTPR